MNAQQKKQEVLRKLNLEIKKVNETDFICDKQDHNWGNPYEAKVSVRDIITYRQRESHEIDCHLDSYAQFANEQPVPVFGEVIKDGWERRCSICGEMEQTIIVKSITQIVGTEPKF